MRVRFLRAVWPTRRYGTAERLPRAVPGDRTARRQRSDLERDCPADPLERGHDDGYEAFDLSLADEGTDRGDHVCYLTEFLSALCLREASLRERGDDEGVAIVVDARRSFLEDHLGRWYWRLADEVGSHDDGAFYAALAELLAALVEHEIETLDLDPDWVPDDPEVTEWNEDVFGDAGRGCGGCGANVGDLG